MPEPSADMVVMGVDPGIAALGWGILRYVQGRPLYVAHGAFHTPSEQEEWDRVKAQIANLREVVEAHKVTVIGVEAWGFYRDCVPVEAHRIGLVIGGILALPVLTLRAGLAAEWHTSVGLAAKCSKADVQTFTQRILRLSKKPTPQHASDALAIALATFPQAVGRARTLPRKDP